MGGHTNEVRLYIQAIRSRIWVVVLLMVVAAGAAVWRAGRIPSQYSAVSTMIVTAPVVAPVPRVTGADDAGLIRPGLSQVTEDILNLIRTRPIAERVAKRLGLSSPSEVQQSIAASSVLGSSLLRVTATARDPELAANLANVTAEEFVGFFRETNRASVVETRRFVEGQLRLARERLEASERAMQAFKESRQMASLAAETAQVRAAMAAAQTDLDAATLALRENSVRLTAARDRLQREQPIIVASRSTMDNPVFRRYQDHLVALEIQRATLAQTYTPQHPRMEQVSREIAELRGRLTAEARTSIAEEVTMNNPIHARLLEQVVNYEVDRAALTARVEALKVTLGRRTAVAMTIPAAETEFNRLTRENRILEAEYTTLSARYQEFLLRENLAAHYPASLLVVEAATPPAQPVPTPLPRTTAAAALAGMVLGIAVALFLESLDDRIRTPEDAERALGVPVLAQIPTHDSAKPAPAPAVFVIAIAIAVMLALAAAVSRLYGATPGIRNLATASVTWLSNPQPALGAIGIAGDQR